ncbi:hypothetical protein UT300018_15500 [Clostridium faecium]
MNFAVFFISQSKYYMKKGKYMKKCLKCKSKLVKCQLCEKHTQLKNTLIVKNKINRKELRICKECGKKFNWI